MKRLLGNKAFLIQGGKILAVLALLGLPLAFSFAKPKKDPKAEAAPAPVAAPALPPGAPPLLLSEAPPPPVEKKAKKKKKGKGEATERANYLTNHEGRKLVHHRFEVPPDIRHAVDFWKLVYSKYDRRHEVFHDTKNLRVIYSVLDFSDIYDSAGLSPAARRALRKERIQGEKDRIRAMLLKLHQGDYTPAQLDAEERRLYDLFQSDPDPLKFLAATEDGRIRSQTGIQDKFTAGLEASGQYLEEIEDIFSSHGVPVEITRLVFVESMFNMKARSKVGASGIWQFMPSTGRLYLGIDSVADERNDPIMASHAAAKLLRANYEALGNWPLAINAYNSGRGTLQRAMSVLGTDDIATIILNYSGGVYGFASRNFYPCFLAALELSNQYPKHFGKLKIKPALKYEYYYPKSPQFFGQLTTAAGANWDEIVHLNPHFSEAVLSDARKIPAGYHLRVPKGSQARFARAEAAILNGDLSPTAIAQTEAERARSEFAPGSSSDSGPAESDLISPANALER